MTISLLSASVYSLLSGAVCVVYPCYKTFTHLYHGVLGAGKKGESEDPRTSCGLFAHHILYWTIYYVFLQLETYFLSFLVPLIPCFYELKLVLFYWLVSDHFKGAGYLFHRHVMKQVLHASRAVHKEIDEKLDVRSKKTIMDLVKQMGTIEDVSFPSMDA